MYYYKKLFRYVYTADFSIAMSKQNGVIHGITFLHMTLNHVIIHIQEKKRKQKKVVEVFMINRQNRNSAPYKMVVPNVGLPGGTK